jgi:hypothetical protein
MPSCLLIMFQLSVISSRLFPPLSPSLNATDFLDLLSKIVAVSFQWTVCLVHYALICVVSLISFVLGLRYTALVQSIAGACIFLWPYFVRDPAYMPTHHVTDPFL